MHTLNVDSSRPETCLLTSKDRIISVVNELICQEFQQCRSLLLCGSLASGNCSISSDVDLVIISNSNSKIDKSLRFKGVRFDIIGGSINYITRLVYDDCCIHRGVYSYMIGNAEILFDENNEAWKLTEWAKHMWEKGTIIESEQLHRYEQVIEQMFANIKNINNDLDSSKVSDGEQLYLIANLVWAVTNYINHKNGWWNGGDGKWKYKHFNERFPLESEEFIKSCYSYLVCKDPAPLLKFISKHIDVRSL